MRPLFVCRNDRKPQNRSAEGICKKDLGGSDRLFEENVEKNCKTYKKESFFVKI